MAIITLSRGTYSGGEKLAQILAARVSYRSISREDIYGCAQHNFGYALEDLVQIMHKAPTRFDKAAEQRRRMFVAIQASLCQMMKGDNVIYSGPAGHLFLLGIPHVLRIRLITPYSHRLQIAVEREGLNPREAGRKIDLDDAEQERWTQFIFGANWTDPTFYDLVLNLEYMNLEEIADVVICAMNLPAFRTSEQSKKKLEDLALSSLVMARILSEPLTENLELKVEADNGMVNLIGNFDDKALRQVLQIASRVEGVRDLGVRPPTPSSLM
jgi:cytidylate kinase